MFFLIREIFFEIKKNIREKSGNFVSNDWQKPCLGKLLKFIVLSFQEPVRFPTRLSENSKSILNGLLEKVPEQRFLNFVIRLLCLTCDNLFTPKCLLTIGRMQQLHTVYHFESNGRVF